MSYLNLAGPRRRIIGMHYLEHINVPVTREQTVEFYDGQQVLPDSSKRARYLSSVLFNILLQMTKGLHADESYDAFRVLRQQVGKTTRQSMSCTLMRVALQMFDENECIDQVTQWEFGISGYGRDSGNTTRVAEDDIVDHYDRRCNAPRPLHASQRLGDLPVGESDCPLLW